MGFAPPALAKGSILPRSGDFTLTAIGKYRAGPRQAPLSLPLVGEGGPLAVDEVPTRTPDFIVSLSNAYDSDLTANLSPALRAARVNARCPSEAAVRAFNGAEG